MLALSSIARAADMPSAPARAYTTAPIFSWTGFYIGLSGGYGTCGNCIVDISGGFVGGQIGGNWQTGQWVFGVEADAFASWIGHSETVAGILIEMNNKSFGTARARVGFAPGPMLLYGTGGYAWANNEISGTLGGVTISSDQTQTGFAAGGGVEYAFAPNWSVKAEYMFLGLGSKNFFGIPSGDLEIHTGKIGLNYLLR